ncbi:ThiF family adenylyltransferase [Sporosarcina sp. Marseille-Q4943]|uniref:ThiF family adenylyltransferase n=1 Tax=Sporosarcina sp. Marseille-Q4943 TaxID=2942204 RepID=UPI00208DD140|nr:ThiF family adenylyltransferase [Sporosarcina sp. Marseille-Q4943]
MNSKYSRQELFAPIGVEGQKRLREASVFVLGAGALGSSGAEMLVRAGIGRLTIVDRDIIEWTNLHRQQLYTEQDVVDQLPKAVAAEKRLRSINKDVQITGIVTDVTPENVLDLFAGHDLIVDATDNIETRLLANDAALTLGLPFFMGACVGSYGLTFPIGVQSGQPCLHCLLDTLPAQHMTCDTVGVISPVVVTTAARQIAGVLKYLTGTKIEPKLESVDVWTEERASIQVAGFKKSDCPSCSEHASYPFLTANLSIRSAVLCGRDTIQLTWPANRKVELSPFAESIRKSVSNLNHNPYLVACEYNGHRIVLFRDGRMLIHGTKNIVTAKKIAAELLG